MSAPFRSRPSAIEQLPLVLSRAQGGELERPLAIVMIGGLITSTLFTLLALPTFYSFVDHLTGRWRKRPA